VHLVASSAANLGRSLLADSLAAPGNFRWGEDMRILVLGGTAWLSRTVAEEAARRGHEVTSASRGLSGPPASGVRHVSVDRSSASADELVAATGADFDAVVDVSRVPSHVRRAVAAYPDQHWVFVSTCSVYADNSTSGATVDAPLLEAVTTDEDPSSSPEVYGAMKVACEESILEGTTAPMIVRAGLIVGPGDPTGRFTYWPARLAGGGEVLAPESPDDPVQVVDVRDLAAWVVDSVEQQRGGIFDGISLPVSRRHLFGDIAQGCAEVLGEPVDTTITWVPGDFLTRHQVEEWAGPRSLPLWVGDPEWQGFMARDTSPAIEAGLRIRPFAETARDTLAWLRSTPDATVTGLTRAEEAEVLGAWHTLGA
jgi:nucleoside-diphosphate-sugar epimerase